MTTSRLMQVSLDDVGSDQSYNFSSPLDDMLKNSIAKHGVLSPPMLLLVEEGEKPYKILIGYNRVAAARLAGLEKIEAKVVESLDYEELAKSLVLKNSLGRINPVAKLKAYYLFMMHQKDSYLDSIRGEFSLPVELCSKDVLSYLFDTDGLYHYLFEKRIAMKILSRFLLLPSDLRDVLAFIMVEYVPKPNNLKLVIQHCEDIFQRDSRLDKNDISSLKDENELLQGLDQIRNPHSSLLFMKAHRLIDEIKQPNVRIVLPDKLEGNSFIIECRIQANVKADALTKLIDSLKKLPLSELQELLR